MQLGLKVLGVVRKTPEREWESKLEEVCQAAEKVGLTPAMIDKVTLRAASTYMGLRDQGPGVVGQQAKPRPYRLREVFADPPQALKLAIDLRAAVRKALTALPATPRHFLLGRADYITDMFLKKWQRDAKTPRATPERFKARLDQLESNCAGDADKEPLRVIRRVIEEMLGK